MMTTGFTPRGQHPIAGAWAAEASTSALETTGTHPGVLSLVQGGSRAAGQPTGNGIEPVGA